MIGRWDQKQTDEKVLYVLSSICSISIIILASIQILGVWKTEINVVEPLLGVLMLIQTIQNWKKNKPVARISLCAAIIIFGCLIFEFVIR
ncbi:hypothetical protein [Clostridium sp. JS66]|uniref:hypothetical protein n=1 Tax=Clostridium sp. JS66 TaxID=3064705 RepID=UPI00298DE7E9|nr:hypothetical protein [Clostridium sp. JS66]WPC42755.1 hypothetical protein Q6H37_04595 [Clostridium sp. JS66]